MTHVLGKNINCFQHIAEELHFMKKCTEITLLLEFLFVEILFSFFGGGGGVEYFVIMQYIDFVGLTYFMLKLLIKKMV